MKVLLTGTDREAIGFFFENLKGEYDLLSSSPDEHDFAKHLSLFPPRIVIYCVSKGISSEQERIDALYALVPHDRMLFGLAGSSRLLSSSDFLIPTPLRKELVVQTLVPYEQAFSEELPEPPRQAADGKMAEGNAESAEEGKKEKEKKEEVKEILKRITRRRILAIDDDPLVLKTLKEYLSGEYDVALARSGAVAYRYLEKNHVDLVLVDFMMPGELGTSVLQNIRNMPYSQNVPAIFLTGANDTGSVSAMLAMRPLGYLLKPVDGEKLLAKLHEVLG